jgi:hypothetical protein
MTGRLTIAVLLTFAAPAAAQELEPRSYSPAPVGTSFLILGVGGSEGALLFDPSLHTNNVRADLAVVTTAFGYTFEVAGHQARVLVALPMAWGDLEGEVAGQVQRAPLNGLVDPRIKLSIGLRGLPALTAAEFASAPRETIVGASLTVVPPIGRYEADRLVNLGYNRWAVKPEIGISRTLGRWTLDGYAGLWLFTTNDEHFPGRARKSQDPVGSLQGHASYALTRRSWLAFDATWFGGGQTRIDGVLSPDEQNNTRLGATLSIPIAAHQSLKVIYSTGTTTRRGSDFNTVTVQWQRVKS